MSDDPQHQSDPADPSRMSFTEHLGELRTRIVRSGIALFVAALGCYIFSGSLIEILAYPVAPLQGPATAEAPTGDAPDATATSKKKHDISWTVLDPLEIVMVKIKMAGYGGLLIAFPFILYQICAFVFPGLRPSERRAAQIIIFGCSGLAAAGVAVAYWGIFPLIVPYLLGAWVPDWVETQFQLSKTLTLVIKGLAAFGIAFQFPMIVLVLVYMDLLSPAGLKKYRRMAIVGMAVVSAMLTPPDPLSMAIMLAPLVLLYEGSILASYVVVRARRKSRQAAP